MHLEQWSGREVAEKLDMNENSVKQAVFRAVHKLRVSMQELQREHYGS
jgi:DNA-directed RNA polymerase specialized sigma24 family protein